MKRFNPTYHFTVFMYDLFIEEFKFKCLIQIKNVCYKINDLKKTELNKLRNDFICFYSVNNSEITKVRNLFIFIL